MGQRNVLGAYCRDQDGGVTHVGCPLKYSVDNYSIFRFIEKRDTVWRKAQIKEEEAIVQWKEVLKDVGIDVVYA